MSYSYIGGLLLLLRGQMVRHNGKKGRGEGAGHVFVAVLVVAVV
jgi:hypothetical protein